MVTEFLQRFIGGKEEITSDWDELIRENLLPVSPSGNNIVTLSDGTATAANEAAIQAAFGNYAAKHGRSAENLCALGFEYGSHGQSPQTLSCSDPAVNLSQEPTHEWPIAPLPKLILPYAANEQANEEEVQRCLDEARLIIEQRRAHSDDVGAIIIEPVTGYGNYAAAPSFYKGLRALAKQEGIPLIVDETKTGMGQTGKMWGHEHWYLSERDGGSADIVTFGGKAGISGYFSTVEISPVNQVSQSVGKEKLVSFGDTWREI